MPEPELYLGDVRLVLQGIGGRRGPQGMDAQTRHRVEQSHLADIVLHDVPVDGCRVQGFGQGFVMINSCFSIFEWISRSLPIGVALIPDCQFSK